MALSITTTRPDRGPLLAGVRNVVAVASGKGGVGKSTVAANIAVALAQEGASVGLVDLDIYGPSVPLMFDLWDQPKPAGKGITPHERYGVKLMSVGFLSERGSSITWRGPLVTKLVHQFVRDVQWGDLDFLIIDLPPGTGDVQLTLSQSVPLSGGIIVTTPQQIALEDVARGINMFEKVDIPVLGVVENMSHFICPGCSEKHYIFGEAGGRKEAQTRGIPFLGEIPIFPDIVKTCDTGRPAVLDKGSPHAQPFVDITHNLVQRLAEIGQEDT